MNLISEPRLRPKATVHHQSEPRFKPWYAKHTVLFNYLHIVVGLEISWLRGLNSTNIDSTVKYLSLLQFTSSDIFGDQNQKLELRKVTRPNSRQNFTPLVVCLTQQQDKSQYGKVAFLYFLQKNPWGTLAKTWGESVS